MAARTSRISLGALVTGVTYRNPAFLAKVVTTLDIVSSGRAILGMGAAWNDAESDAYGYDFPRTAERFDRLDPAILKADLRLKVEDKLVTVDRFPEVVLEVKPLDRGAILILTKPVAQNGICCFRGLFVVLDQLLEVIDYYVGAGCKGHL